MILRCCLSVPKNISNEKDFVYAMSREVLNDMKMLTFNIFALLSQICTHEEPSIELPAA